LSSEAKRPTVLSWFLLDHETLQITSAASAHYSSKLKTENDMNLPIDGPDNAKPAWKTPIFQEIPISFEASSYALTDDDPLYC